MVHCRNCDREMPNDSIFCPYCGLKRSFIITNYDLPSEASAVVASTLSSIYSYFLTGSSLGVHQYQVSPIAQAEQEDFQSRWVKLPQQFIQSILTGTEAVQDLGDKTLRDERATEIVKLLVDTNIVFLAKKNAKFLREDHPNAVSQLHTPCCDYNDFIVKIASLATLFEVDLRPLRRLVASPGRKGSIKLIEDFLNQQQITYDSDMIQTWKNIKTLRNMPPLHAGRRNSREARRYLRALRFFRTTFPIDYSKLWDHILDRFLDSLRKWQQVLQQIQ